MCGTLRNLWRTLAAALVLAAAAAPAALADEDDRTDAVEQVLRHDRDLERRVVAVGRVRFSVPQRLSGSIGAMVVRQPKDWHCTTVCEFQGWLVQAEPGLAGGQLSAGYAVLNADKEHRDRLLSNVFLGYGIKGALLRTWGDSGLNPEEQTLLGLEGDFTVIQLNFSLGVFRHVGSGDADDEWLVTGGVGWGF